MKIKSLKTGFLIVCFGLAVGSGVQAYFDDTEETLGNQFGAGTLDFHLEMLENSASKRGLEVVSGGTLDFEYSIKTDNKAGELCDYLNITAFRNGSGAGSTGSLKDFNFFAGRFSGPDRWVFSFSLTDEDPLSASGSICSFDLIFDGVQTGGEGFYDQESLSIEITVESLIPAAEKHDDDDQGQDFCPLMMATYNMPETSVPEGAIVVDELFVGSIDFLGKEDNPIQEEEMPAEPPIEIIEDEDEAVITEEQEPEALQEEETEGGDEGKTNEDGEESEEQIGDNNGNNFEDNDENSSENI